MTRPTRRTLLLLPLLGLGRPAAAQPRAAALTERDRADIAAAEAWLNRLGSVKARFLQIAQNGAAAEGTAWILRPGRMRFEYDQEPLLRVASQAGAEVAGQLSKGFGDGRIGTPDISINSGALQLRGQLVGHRLNQQDFAG